ncbi:hypothetical protein CYY_008005 [Polysphondylium violaceum]|uniref:RNA helicase n=1 Tax=Polysphondylium violaceum TaxID=133409 RepID=A0A8J4V4F4_9MYCE|nr:hypothetical protein CYY_008005 [Polysphondylium violaceum]
MKKASAKPAPSNDKDKDKKGGKDAGKDVKGAKDTKGTGGKDTGKDAKDKKGKDAPFAAAPAVPEKPRWTGKTPVQYLNEYCQKNHMDKPIYQDVKSFQPNTFRCRITLAFEGKKKTKTTKDYASALSMPTVMEAKTYSALVALHDLCGNTTIYKLFPPEYTPYWMSLQEEAKKEAEKAKVEQAEEAEQLRIYEEEKAAAPQHSQIIPQIHMSEEAMRVVHSLVLQLGLNNTATNTDEVDRRQLDEKEKEIMTSSLMELGFQVDDIKEALTQTQNYTDVNGIIGWLCLHVPNNQLPLHFKPKSIGLDKKSSSTTSNSNSTYINDPSYKESFKQLGNLGFTRDQINRAIDGLCKDGYKATIENSENTLQRLYYSLWKLSQSSSSLDDTTEDIENEKMALESIYQDNSQFTFISDRHYRYRVQHDKLIYCQLDITIPVWCKYPHQLPVFSIQSPSSIPILNHLIIKHLNQELNQLLGTPMVFSIISFLDSNLDDIINMKQEITSLHDSITTGGGDDDDNTTVLSNDIKQLSINSSSNNSSSSNKKRNINSYNRLSKMDKDRLDKELKEEYCKLHNQETENAVEQKRKMLPVFKKKVDFLEAINNNQVLVITAETGCGKSTQIPQYILESFVRDGNASKCNIVCTQPRRISAIGVAERVAYEWSGGDDKSIGKTIGYQIRNESKRSRDTRLLFCTTGILLRRILDVESIADVSHIIIDEVHERSTDNDFLLIILREIISKRKDLKIILMSATLNANQISKYFGCDQKSIFSIPGFTFPVKNYHLDDYFGQLKTYLPLQPKTTSTTSTAGEESLETKLSAFNIGFEQKRVNADIVESLLLHLVENKVGRDKSILVFVPGLADILDMCYRLSHPINSVTGMVTDKIWCVPLHSSLSPKDQQKVFQKAPKGKTKVVISTNIAETSITIEDVEIVVDCGRVNQMVYDSKTRNSVMSETWTSKASCRQRAGRAGRTSHGMCYKVFTKDMEAKLDDQDTPEILRSSLQQLCLHVCLFLTNMKAGNLSIQGFLSRAIEPPSSQQILSSINELISINALDSQQKLTPLGYHLANLPVDVYIGKMLLFGCIFRCIDPILTIAAVLSSKSPFLNPPDKKIRPQQAFSIHQSDHLSLVNVYNQWKQSIASGKESSFIKDNYLSLPVLQTIQDLKFQFIETLSEIGFLPSGITSKALVKEQKRNKGSDCVDQVCGYIYNSNSDKTKILTGVICAGMYPKIARIDYPTATYSKTASGAQRNKFQADDLLIQTNTDGKLTQTFVHPRSVNYKEGEYTYPFLIYHDRVLTSRLFLHNISNITPLTLLLFSIGGDIELNKTNYQEITLDKWLIFKPTSGKIAVLFNEVRILFNHLLKQKIDNPDYSTHSSIIIDIITKLVMSEGYL